MRQRPPVSAQYLISLECPLLHLHLQTDVQPSVECGACSAVEPNVKFGACVCLVLWDWGVRVSLF